MAKSRTCFSSEVCCSDSFERLPQSARLLYYQLNFEANLIGEVIGAHRVARGYGFSGDDMQSLIDAGYLIAIDGRCFIRHHFTHNRLANDAQKRAAANHLDNAPDWLEFEGEPCKSTYRLVKA